MIFFGRVDHDLVSRQATAIGDFVAEQIQGFESAAAAHMAKKFAEKGLHFVSDDAVYRVLSGTGIVKYEVDAVIVRSVLAAAASLLCSLHFAGKGSAHMKALFEEIALTLQPRFGGAFTASVREMAAKVSRLPAAKSPYGVLVPAVTSLFGGPTKGEDLGFMTNGIPDHGLVLDLAAILEPIDGFAELAATH